MPPAARVGDLHACASTGAGPVGPPGSSTVNIGYSPAARAGDRATAGGALHMIVQGSPTVFIDGRPAVRAGDRCSRGGVIVTGCGTVNIGNTAGPTGIDPPPAVTDDDDARRRGGSGGAPAAGTRSPGPVPPDAVAGSAAPRPPGTQPASATPADKKTKTAGEPGAGGGEGHDGEDHAASSGKGPRLHGVPVSMDVIRSLIDLAKQYVPGLGEKIPPVDPEAVQATAAQLRDAVARHDVGAINSVGAQLTALLQRSTGASAGLDQHTFSRPSGSRAD
jgi:uncharacterized Zn-binding protein involved in type VI secretion